jgi:hypothetical protein
LDGIRELDVENIPKNALDLIEYARSEHPNFNVIFNLLESYFTQAGELIDRISELNEFKSSGEDTYPIEFSIEDRMEHFMGVLEDISYSFNQIKEDKHPVEIDVLVSAAENFVSYLKRLPYKRKSDGVIIVDASQKQRNHTFTGYHQ